MITKFRVLLGFILIAAMLTACGGNASQPESADSNKPEGTKQNTGGSKPIELTFYYPIQMGGPLTETIEGMTEQFTKENPDIKVKAVYTGNYDDSTVKIQAAVQGKNPPDVAVHLSVELFTMLDMDAIVGLDEFIAKDGGDEYLSDFYPAFMDNSQINGKTYSIPFQRSTPVLYYNKEAFKEAGLDPEKAPASWEDLISFGKALTKDGQWGVEIPSSASPSTWMFTALALQSGNKIMSDDGTEVYFDTPENVEALQFWLDLSKKHNVMPSNIIEWDTTPSDFLEKRTAIMYNSTGNLSNIKKNATFDFGVGFLPMSKQYGSPTGGGNFYIFKDIPQERQEAAWKFVKWMSDPERAAQWSIDTGYVAVRKSAYETERMKEYTASFPPALVARDQLEYASAELSTHNNNRVTKALRDAVQAALTGTMTPQEALKRAQEEADKALEPYKK